MQRAAKQTANVTGGSLDYLIHNAARMNETIMSGFDSLYVQGPSLSIPFYFLITITLRSETMDELDADFITSVSLALSAVSTIL